MKNTVIILCALVLFSCGDSSISVSSFSDSKSTSDAKSTSDSSAISTSEIKEIPCEICRSEPEKADIAELLLFMANAFAVKNPEIRIEIVNSLYADAMAQLEKGNDTQTIEADFAASLINLEEGETTT